MKLKNFIKLMRERDYIKIQHYEEPYQGCGGDAFECGAFDTIDGEFHEDRCVKHECEYYIFEKGGPRIDFDGYAEDIPCRFLSWNVCGVTAFYDEKAPKAKRRSYLLLYCEESEVK